MLSTISVRLLSSLNIASFEEDIDGAVEAVAVRDIRAVNPALVAELFDCEGEQYPNSPYASQAKDRLAALEKRQFGKA